MTDEVEFSTFPLSGKFKRKPILSFETEPCKHNVIYKERLLRKDKVVIFHGYPDGTYKLSKEDGV